MTFYQKFKRFIQRRIGTDFRSSSEQFIACLKKKGVKIGQNTIVFDPHNIEIDVTRPELLEIGSHVFLHRGTKILTHDWASWCFVYSHAEFLPSHGKVTIGNNVWLGENVTICKGVKIGDNVIIGIGSVVTKSIPSNSVAAGVPAKVLCSYDEYYQKRQKQYVNELVE
jgi:acetyltransferase-like isoleucine patch superfamily enzyme